MVGKGTVTTNDLIDFLRDRLAEDKDHARVLATAAKLLDRQPDFYGAGGPAAQDYWQHFTPARMLADVEAKRGIVNLMAEATRPGWDPRSDAAAVRLAGIVLGRLAEPYADHPDYRPEWAQG